MNILRYIFSVLFVCLMASPSSAQTHKDTLKLNRPVSKVYRLNDNLFWGISAGGNYSMSEYVRNQSFFKMLSPQFDAEFGKHFNRWFAARVSLGFHSHHASTPLELQTYFPDASSYRFSMIAGYVDPMICLNHVFGRYNPERRNQFWLFGGVGGLMCFDYSNELEEWQKVYPIDTKTGLYFSWHAGLEWHHKMSNSTSLVLRGTYVSASSGYTGNHLDSERFRHSVEFSVGINVHLGNRYGQRNFEYSNHNANRYFEVMNGRLAKMHQKSAKRKAKVESKATGRKVAPLQNLTESDTILLFPVDYYYLTYAQKMKLNRMAEYLVEHPDLQAHIHIYPDAGSVGSMEMEFRVKNRAERVVNYLTDELQLSPDTYVITTHPQELSPYPRQHIFTLGGIIRYEKKI
ncbi:MAG: hypothetical protein K6C30_06030 [Bacteroidaceae bacterium]|nr:hypothetical protein [Bacteroidaceae bacterium]